MSIEKLGRTDLRKVKKTAETYGRVFAGPEWNEVSRCPTSGTFYGSDNPVGTRCPCCRGKLEEAYPPIETTGYIRDEISSNGSVAIIEEEDGKPKAFGWAYRLLGSAFAKKKYREENVSMIEEIVEKDEEYFYISEVGVVAEKQGRGLGKKITKALAGEGEKEGLPLLLRTSNKSTMAKIARNDLGMEVVMGDEDSPVDPENSNRLLFIKKKK